MSALQLPNPATSVIAAKVEYEINISAGMLIEFKTSDGNLHEGQLVGIYFNKSGNKQLVYSDTSVDFKEVLPESVIIANHPHLIPAYYPASPFILNNSGNSEPQNLLIEEKLGFSTAVNLQSSNLPNRIDELRLELFDYFSKNASSIIEVILVDRTRFKCIKINPDPQDQDSVIFTKTDNTTLQVKLAEVDEFDALL